MGICDSSSNSNINQASAGSLGNSTQNLNGKYFVENTNLQSQNSLVLNNDVIVSDTHQDPEKLYEKVKMLGEGSFGEVWLVQNKILKKEYAMKVIEKSPYSNTKQIINEINILKTLDHPNILKILEFHLDKDKFYIITDYCPEGELFHEISKKGKFSETETAFIIYQILQAVRYCHKMRIIHRDIKPENIMIYEREKKWTITYKIN